MKRIIKTRNNTDKPVRVTRSNTTNNLKTDESDDIEKISLKHDLKKFRIQSKPKLRKDLSKTIENTNKETENKSITNESQNNQPFTERNVY
ncbi:hypothetical protein NQ314_013762 [Rhamnusium bicolor]|uniref:Uncharacterized protein n=1 Tax=Rhamnusium bicolor TaxID=1586634 RepID=A0AAV8X517_9CUCU|nr:hypothetical protein NQ314_013762 [Rhamnusium bicolor]